MILSNINLKNVLNLQFTSTSEWIQEICENLQIKSNLIIDNYNNEKNIIHQYNIFIKKLSKFKVINGGENNNVKKT